MINDRVHVIMQAEMSTSTLVHESILMHRVISSPRYCCMMDRVSDRSILIIIVMMCSSKMKFLVRI